MLSIPLPPQVLRYCHTCPRVIEALMNSYDRVRVSQDWVEAVPAEVVQVRGRAAGCRTCRQAWRRGPRWGLGLVEVCRAWGGCSTVTKVKGHIWFHLCSQGGIFSFICLWASLLSPQKYPHFYQSLFSLEQRPRCLQHLARCALRTFLEGRLLLVLPQLQLPRALHRFLLLGFEDVLY